MIVMAGVGCGLWAYTWIYPYALPLLQAETGRYALLSPGHAANLLNQVLLLSPFLLLWPAEAVLRQGTRDPEHWFLLWASVGTSALVVGHDAFLGGRDWDLLSLPAPYLLLWGFVALPALRDKSHLRLVRYAVLPIMAAHTALFIGIGARPVAAKERVLSLMERGNRAEHYREFELGYHLLGDGQDPLTAVKHFSRAVQLASTEGTEALGTRVRYQLYLAAALCSSGNWGECLAVTDSILRAGEQLSPNARVLLFRNRAMALLGVARLGGRAAVVDSLRRLATEVVSVLVVDEPTSGNYNMLAHLRANAGDLLGARNALVRSVEINPRQGIVQFALGEVYAKTGDKSRALDHLERAAELDSSHAEKVRVLVESLKLATPD